MQRTLSAAKNGPILNSPKRNKSRRSVKLTALALEALRAYRERQTKEREKLDGLWQDHGLVFASTIGTPLNRHNVFGRSLSPSSTRRVSPTPSAFTTLGTPARPYYALRTSTLRWFRKC
jgi:hypothetical protein